VVTGDELVRALEGRVRIFTESRDTTAVLDEAAIVQAQQVGMLLADPTEDGRPGRVEALTALGWLYWSRYQAIVEGDDNLEVDTSLALFSRVLSVAPEKVPESVQKQLTRAHVLPDAAADAYDQGMRLVGAYKRTGDLSELDRAVEQFRQAINDIPVDHPAQALHVASLAYTLQTRYVETGRSDDLDQAIALGRRLVSAIPPSHPVRITYLSDLGDALRTRAVIAGQPDDLDAAIDFFRDAAKSVLPTHPDRPTTLSNLAVALQARYRQTGQQSDLDEAADLLQQALDPSFPEHRQVSVPDRGDRTAPTESQTPRRANPPSPEVPRRVVNSRICRAGTDIDLPTGVPLKPKTDYEILVNIGRADVRSLITNAVFPDQHLPPCGLWLTVVVYAPGFLEEPEERAIYLPEQGDSYACPCLPDEQQHECSARERDPFVRIPFTTLDSRHAAKARVAIYYRAAVIHVHELMLPVGEGSGPTGSVVYVLTQSFDDLGAFAKRTLSVMTAPGDAKAQVYVNGMTTRPLAYSYDSLAAEEASQRARVALFGVHLSADPPWRSLYNSDLGKTQGDYETDLLTLAEVGRTIYSSFFHDAPQQVEQTLRHEASAGPAIVQIARPTTEKLAIPWQMAYDLPLQTTDRDIYHCRSLREFGPDAEIAAKIPSKCPHLDEHPKGRSILCPFGFWGLSHILEVPPHLGEQPGLPRVVDTDVDVPLTTLVGWNAQLSPEPESFRESQRHLTALRHVLGILMPVVQSRRQLGEALGPSDMDLVYLYCHGERYTPPGASVSDPLLVLGSGESFTPQDVSGWSQLYDWPDPHWRDRPPLVVLNACHSGASLAATLADFVGVFTQTAGAAGVIATEVTLEQKVAGLAMETFLTELAIPGISVGEAMRRMRWTLLKRGNLMGLAYSPYCAADLLLRPATTLQHRTDEALRRN
jgi:tetratricopeptide (TPR) repeat protein